MLNDLKNHFEKDSYAKWLGISIEELDYGYAKVTMNIKDDMVNFHGAANGGAIFSLADVAFACASNSYGQTAVGINVTIYYLKAGAVGDRLTAIAKEDFKSNKVGSYRMEIYNENNDLIALAEGMVFRKRDDFLNT
ncbi:hydroxyphenylacetyl-CoA thioesterase PaaI [Salipaludibacillus keqinensis]|uniref:hydroxyphenylacetyl-CoA thioesterase PaaI n=1 Tax=Salipaludibacillus keqinensis TaxID=2045207 RepID=UPI001E658A4B|nr:hydroxyphenylacetyl-CoA thioesterase PaaI [Salipaludibacillus keqinensis]